MPAGGDVAIRTEHLAKSYRSGGEEVVVFSDLNFAVYRGERLAIVGESGAGKSTLLYLLGGLDRPSGGRIYFGSKEITTLADSDLAEFRNRQIGFVWQTHCLLPEFTALENVMMPLLIRGASYTEAAEAARSRLEEVGLGKRATHRAGELSGGEQQRVALARALVGQPAFLLADEPTGNLDLRTGERMIALLAEVHRSHRLTSLYVTHNLSFARRCDRVLKLEAGCLGPIGAGAEVFTPAAAMEAGSFKDENPYV
ncbi:MAG: ABC transporter ATP-binding protein [Bryobacterales bacterium]|nr:ABC transporter ATP-binding protein [Bryobacteraceae bacterium]MDW8354000.1 ABC transporter ATP-binding protein [Bryobacterales bacterium]